MTPYKLIRGERMETPREETRRRVIRLFLWAHRRFMTAFHAVGDPDRSDRMAAASAICQRIRPLAVRYGVLHADSPKPR